MLAQLVRVDEAGHVDGRIDVLRQMKRNGSYNRNELARRAKNPGYLYAAPVALAVLQIEVRYWAVKAWNPAP